MKKIISLIFLVMCLFIGIQSVSAAEMQFEDISTDVETAVMNDLVLPDTWEGSSVHWTTDGVYILEDGTVNRPYPDDREVTISAEYGGTVTTFNVTVKAFASKKEIVETAALYFAFSDITAEDSNSVSSDLYLPGTGLYNTGIIWESDNTSLVRITSDGNGNYVGEVNCVNFGEGNYGVRLTAIFYYDNEFCEKHFYINVAEEDTGYALPDEFINVRNLYRSEFLKNNDIFDLRNDLILPDIDTDMSITCVSEDSSVVTTEGIVTRDNHYDKKTEFTVIFRKGYISTNLTIPLIVTAYSNDELEDIPKEDVKNIIAEITRSNSMNAVTNNLNLKTTGAQGSTITWSSSDASVITDTGIITRESSDRSATLTVTAEFKGHVYTQTLDVIVKKNSTASVEAGFPLTGGSPTTSSQGSTVINPSENERIYFEDIDSGHWAYENIMQLVEASVVNGYDDNTFRPNNAVLREEFVKMLLLATDNYSSGYDSEFSDVPADSWYYTYVSCASEKGIVQGFASDIFGSGVSISRQDAAVMICRALGIETETVNETAFPDFDNISEYAQNAVYTLYEKGVIDGDDNGYFNPKNNITRAEVSKILSLVM